MAARKNRATSVPAHGSTSDLGSTSAKKSGFMTRLIFVVAAIVLILCLAALALFGLQYCVQQKAYDDFESYADTSTLNLADLKVDWEGLSAINPDICAWIYVPGTKINYPVVHGTDNEIYLHKSFDGGQGFFSSAGTIFLDANNNPDMLDRNNALYGHHMNDGSMFATFADWSDSATFNEHRSIYVLTPRGNYRCTTFAYIKTTGSDAIVQTRFPTENDYQAYIQDKLNRSLVKQEGTVLTLENIRQSFMFSTCEYTNNDGRAIIFAAVVETTIPDDPYIKATKVGSTDITAQDQSAQLDAAA